jgi:hypothetical protein
MPGGIWPSPLAFYCYQNGILIGEDAAMAAQSGTANAFDNYFERLSGGETYLYGGQNKQIGNLLLDAAETVFREFYSNILFNRYGSIAENRANMPLLLACESDIEPNEKAYLTSLFKDSGYSRMRVVEYDTYIERYINDSLSKKITCDNVLVAWSEGVDLRLTLFQIHPQQFKKYIILEGLGVDPRMEYVKSLIWDAVFGQNQWLAKDREIAVIEKAAADFLNSSAPMISEYVTLSDGQNYKYSLTRTSVDFIQSSETQSMKYQLGQFLQSVGVTNRDKTLLLLRGITAGNSYFEQNLRYGFFKTIRSDEKIRCATMDLLLREQIPAIETTTSADQDSTEQVKKSQPVDDRLKEFHKRWRQIKADIIGKSREIAKAKLDRFKSECECFDGASQLILEVNSEIERLTPTQNPEQIKGLERKWREVKATAKAKVRAKNYSEASQIIKAFMKDCESIFGSEELLSKASEEYELIPKSTESMFPKKEETYSSPTSKHKVGDKHPTENWVWTEYAPGKFDWRADKKEPKHKVGDKHPTKPWVWTEYEPGKFDWRVDKSTPTQSESLDHGRNLLSHNKVKEARDWYREKGDSQKARLLSDIIRAQKGVDLRKRTIDDYRKSKNADQLKRIIEELEKYVDLCDKVGLPAADFKKLLSEYRKIK